MEIVFRGNKPLLGDWLNTCMIARAVGLDLVERVIFGDPLIQFKLLTSGSVNMIWVWLPLDQTPKTPFDPSNSVSVALLSQTFDEDRKRKLDFSSI